VGWRHTEEMSGYYLQELTGEKDVFAGHAHNNFLDLLGGAGVLGALTWLAYCAFVLAILYRALRRDRAPGLDFARGMFCAWLVFQINGLTQVNFWEGKVEHQVAWMIAWALLWSGDDTRSSLG
jgi:O-antigen ligase